jgi:hypothetical protein
VRLGVRVYIVRQGQVLFLQDRDHAGQDALQAPTLFVTDYKVMVRDIALQLVKESTGLDPREIYSCGTISFRGPSTPNFNISVWLYRDGTDGRSEPTDPKRQWLAVEPSLSPEIPELDRLWLPFVLRRADFTASITYSNDGLGPHALVRARRATPRTPLE